MTTEPSTLSLTLLILIVFPLFFGLIWSTVSLLLSWLSGWRSLARHYRTTQTPQGNSLGHYWMMLGISSYRGVTTLRAAPEGLYCEIMVLFRLGHPTLLIPWRDIKASGTARRGLFNWATFELGNPRITTMRLQSSEKMDEIVKQFLLV